MSFWECASLLALWHAEVTQAFVKAVASYRTPKTRFAHRTGISGTVGLDMRTEESLRWRDQGWAWNGHQV